MSGHSKWSTIKRQKGINDQKRGQIFTKLSRAITLSVSEGGGITDPEKNVKLRLAIARAREENMPKDNIERAIERAKGPEASNLKEAVYEGFGRGGVSLMIVATTDNPNRTHSQIKTTLEKLGCKLGSVHSVAYLFEKCGIVVFDKKECDENALFSITEKLGALDVEDDGASYIVYIPFESLGTVAHLEGSIVPTTMDVFYRPTTTVSLNESDIQQTGKLVEALEELDDVSKVYTNYV